MPIGEAAASFPTPMALWEGAAPLSDTTRTALAGLARRIEFDDTHALHLVTVVPFDRVPECAEFLRRSLTHGTHVVEVRFAGPEISPITALLERLPEDCFATPSHPTLTPDDLWLIFVFGLDASLDPRAHPDVETALLHLNLHRDTLLRLRAPTVFWLREDTLHRIATRLADLWSWAGGVVEVREPLPPSALPPPDPVGRDWKLLNLTGAAKQSRIGALTPLINRLRIQAGPLSRTDRRLLVEALLEVGTLQHALGEPDAARAAFETARTFGTPPSAGEDPDALQLYAATLGSLADLSHAQGDLDEALRIRQEEELPVHERLQDVRSRAITWGQIADIREARGDLDEALRIRQTEEIPVYERLGDRLARAVGRRKVADILKTRGKLDEALDIYRQECLPVAQQVGAVRDAAVFWGCIADVLEAQGELDEALRIRQTEELPVYERLQDERSRAITWGQIAGILVARGDLDEALRLYREERLPVAEQLGDARGKALTWCRIADILYEQGNLDEALRIRQTECVPVLEQVGDARSLSVERVVLACALVRRDGPGDREVAGRLLRSALAAAEQRPQPEAKRIRGLMRQLGIAP